MWPASSSPVQPPTAIRSWSRRVRCSRSTRTSMPRCRSIRSRICCRSRPLPDELLLTENPALDPQSFRDFIAYAGRAKPPLLYGSIGNGSEHHLAMELLKEQAGLQMTHVPYRGGAAAALGVM